MRYINVKGLRQRFGITQENLGMVIGCSRANAANKEQGRVEWTITEMKLLQEYFNDKLVKDGDNPQTLDQIFLPTMCH